MITVRTGLVICDAPTRRCKKSRYEYTLAFATNAAPPNASSPADGETRN